ncbi:hypothetical protein C8Q80DRAFT_1275468 [Daedaleopsis nitida]|nr:hypothetical protein C8Q80DRAFT_1275468 [Daedaleopsis nitida]
MSSDPSSADNDAIIQEFQSFQTAGYCDVAVYAFLLYEHAITIRQEVDLFWKHKANGATVLFFSNRFLILVIYTLTIASNAHMSDTSLEVMVYLLYLPWAAFAALRAFALSQNMLLAIIVFALSAVTIALNFFDYSVGPVTGLNDPLVGCVLTDGLSLSAAKKSEYTAERVDTSSPSSRTCQIAADVLLIITTWKTTYQKTRLHTVLDHSLSFSEVLFRDGMIYFVVLVILNSVHLTFTMLSIAIPNLDSISFVGNFTTPIYSVLVSRFLIDLQMASRNAVDGGSSMVDAGDGDSIIFNRIIGSIGSSISPHHMDDYSESSEPEGEEEGATASGVVEAET